jgi:hypothetical protein
MKDWQLVIVLLAAGLIALFVLVAVLDLGVRAWIGRKLRRRR